jgi:hypothetical protein
MEISPDPSAFLLLCLNQPAANEAERSLRAHASRERVVASQTRTDKLFAPEDSINGR